MDNIKHCKMLYIGKNAEPALQDILSLLQNQPIVTISDIAGFTGRGGIFGFSIKDQKVIVELNLANAKAQGININSALHGMIKMVEQDIQTLIFTVNLR